MQLIFISLNINLTNKLIWGFLYMIFKLPSIHFLQLIWVLIKETAEVETKV